MEASIKPEKAISMVVSSPCFESFVYTWNDDHVEEAKMDRLADIDRRLSELEKKVQSLLSVKKRVINPSPEPYDFLGWISKIVDDLSERHDMAELSEMTGLHRSQLSRLFSPTDTRYPDKDIDSCLRIFDLGGYLIVDINGIPIKDIVGAARERVESLRESRGYAGAAEYFGISSSSLHHLAKTGTTMRTLSRIAKKLGWQVIRKDDRNGEKE